MAALTDAVLQVPPSLIWVVLEGLREVRTLDDLEEGEESNRAAADGHVRREAIGKSSFEEIDLISMNFN
jgi:hypothetical protein